MNLFRHRRALTCGMILLLAVAGTADEKSREEAPAAKSETSASGTSAESRSPFDQRALVENQHERLEEIRHGLDLFLRSAESEHFLLFTDLSSEVRRAILRWLEDLRTKLIQRLGLEEERRLWDGKCLAIVFAEQKSLKRFAEAFDDHHVERPRGYFVLERRRADGPRLVHIATFQPVRGGNQALREILVHETTHAIVELYRHPTPLPLWLHEGLAECMTVVMDPTLRPRKQARAYEAATKNPHASIQDVFEAKFPPSDLAAYSISMGLVECLYAMDDGAMLEFISLLKDGVEPEAALGRAYPGLDYPELERRWRRFCARAYKPSAAETKAHR